MSQSWWQRIPQAEFLTIEGTDPDGASLMVMAEPTPLPPQQWWMVITLR
jgi:hypothetical protein